MKRFIEGEDRSQSTLFPQSLDDYIAEDNPIRVIDVFVEEFKDNGKAIRSGCREWSGGGWPRIDLRWHNIGIC